MKQSFSISSRVLLYILFCSALLSSFVACKKHDNPFDRGNNASRYSSEVIDKWLTMQLRLMRNTSGINGLLIGRYYAYSGVAAFLSLQPGTSINSFDRKFNGLTMLPVTDKTKRVYWPASVNAALASMNRVFFTTASDNDKAAIDSLETALNNSFLFTQNSVVISESNAFGKDVANAVFSWSETDGYKHANDPYTPPTGPGLWVPTPPAFAPPLAPYWGNNRPIIAGSGDNTQPGPPTPYSENSKSEFFQMAKQVYDVSQNLTPDQIAMALFWRDAPVYAPGGHWLSILQQVLKQTDSPLDKAAFVYALTGICINDALISSWQTRFHYNLVRPVTYIQNVMGYPSWNSLIITPSHPEYTSAQTSLSVAAAKAFTAVYGNIGSFTDHTYDYLGFAPRTFNSFDTMAAEASISRFYAGIHYQPSLEAAQIQGRKVAENILKKLKLKDK